MKSNNNRNNKRNQNKINENTNELNQKLNNNINLGKSHSNFRMKLPNLSSSNGNFNNINNIRDSKVIKIKNIIKKSAKPIYTKKEKEPSNDSDSDYGNEEDDDFNNILRESMSIQSLKTSNTNPFSKKEPKKEKTNEIIDKNKLEKITYNKLNKHFNNNNDFINKFPKEEKNIDNNDKEEENFFFKNPNIDTNKSTNIEDYINPIRNEIIQNKNIPGSKNKKITMQPKKDYEYNNLLEKNNIFNNQTDIINLEINNQKEPNCDINIDRLIDQEKKIENNILKIPDSKNRIMNLNLFIDKKLKEINFMEKLKSISDSRYSFFEKNYRKDNYFLNENSFDNILVSEKNLKIQSPLSLIFQKIFSPDNPKRPFEKNFFEKILSSGDNSNYLPYFDKNELSNVPRFFNDLSYANDLFNSFDFNELNNFLEGIKTWENTFHLEQEYTHELNYFKPNKKYISLKNILIIYFISPYDLIIDSHLTSSGIPFSDTVMALNQFIFHCDIKFDSKKGKFLFKTSAKILNSIKMLKNTAINNTIKEEGKNENDKEIINNIWTPMKKEITEQDLLNQKNAEEIYKKYLENNLNKFINILPNDYNDIKIVEEDSEEIWDSFTEKSDKNEFDDDNIIQKNNNKYIYTDDMNERNTKILKMGGLLLIVLYLIKIFFSAFSLDTIFGIFWICLIGYLFYKFR